MLEIWYLTDKCLLLGLKIHFCILNNRYLGSLASSALCLPTSPREGSRVTGSPALMGCSLAGVMQSVWLTCSGGPKQATSRVQRIVSWKDSQSLPSSSLENATCGHVCSHPAFLPANCLSASLHRVAFLTTGKSTTTSSCWKAASWAQRSVCSPSVRWDCSRRWEGTVCSSLWTDSPRGECRCLQALGRETGRVLDTALQWGCGTWVWCSVRPFAAGWFVAACSQIYCLWRQKLQAFEGCDAGPRNWNLGHKQIVRKRNAKWRAELLCNPRHHLPPKHQGVSLRRQIFVEIFG